MFTCQHCNTELKTKSGLARHKNSCKSNPAKVLYDNTIETFVKDVDNLMATTTNIQSFFEDLSIIFAKAGIEVIFNSIPLQAVVTQNTFNQTVFQGCYKGSFTLLEGSPLKHKYKHLRFGDVTTWGYLDTYALNFLPFITKDTFDSYVKIPTKALPLIHKQLELQGFQLKIDETTYTSKHQEFCNDYKNSRNRFVSNNKEHVKIVSLIEEAKFILDNLNKAKHTLENSLEYEFNNEHPLPETTFSPENISKLGIELAKLKIGYAKQPCLKKHISDMEQLVNRTKKYINENPEALI